MSLFQLVRIVGMAACIAAAATALTAQGANSNRIFEMPSGVEALEGIPDVRVDSDQDQTTHRVLTDQEAEAQRLRVQVVDGQFYWSSRNERPLKLEKWGDFVYLSSEPGSYIRLTRINNRLTYVEHVDFASHSVTWWGELKIVVGR